MNELLETTSGNPVKSAARSLDLLELLADYRDGLTLAEVCLELQWPKSSTLALVRTLRDRGYISDGRRERSYRLGPRLVTLGSAYLGGIDLVREGQDVVREVAGQCNETVHLATRNGRNVIYVAKEEGTKQLRMVSAVGKTVPAHGTGVGKMLLSALSAEEFERLYPVDHALESLTPSTIVDRERLKDDLVVTRARGFARDDGESTLGLCCVAAPVYDATGQMVAAMSVSVPSPAMTAARQQLLHRVILEGASVLSRRLGWVSPVAINATRERA